MPQSKEVHREYMRHRREGSQEGSQKGRFTGEGSQGLTKDGTFFKDGVEMVMPLGTLPARPRDLKLSDGQVLDRANLPKPNLKGLGRSKLIALGCLYGPFRPLGGRVISPQRRLAMIEQALDKEVTGLDGRKENLLEKVRCGVSGPTLAEIRASYQQCVPNREVPERR